MSEGLVEQQAFHFLYRMSDTHHYFGRNLSNHFTSIFVSDSNDRTTNRLVFRKTQSPTRIVCKLGQFLQGVVQFLRVYEQCF